MTTIDAVYRLRCAAGEAERIARDIALEQTVEVPEALVPEGYIRDAIVGRIAGIVPAGDGVYDATIRYNAELACGQLPQLFNLLFGNISIKPGIRLVDLALPAEFVSRFKGPNFGAEGLRRMLGVYGRPLLATALKPRGSSNETLAQLAGDFVHGGGDIVKDDHNLAEESFEAWRSRVRACHEAVTAANERTGRYGQYFPNVLSPVEDLDRGFEFLMALGVRGVLISPLLVGLDQTRRLAATYPMVFMTHPAFTGSFYVDRSLGIAPDILLGKLFRLMGGDISVFPNYGGRFGLTEDECKRIHRALGDPWDALAPALPAPAGGMQFDRLDSMAATYGAESVFLIGGALLSHGADLADSTRTFLDAINGHFAEDLHEPDRGLVSACEVPSARLSAMAFMAHRNGEWDGRPAMAYKADGGSLPFEGVKRVELIGKHGEKTAFDLRYFELEPGGFTSHEKHVHTHTVIAVRGQGILDKSGERTPLNPLDIAYIGPLEAHQLRNESGEPFGFFCIVDHERDRPMAP